MVYQQKQEIIKETKEVHVLFHSIFGYGGNTISQFCEFLKGLLNTKSMPISSQASLEGLEGSETRAYDSERVMKLHERLEEIDKEFKSMQSQFPII